MNPLKMHFLLNMGIFQPAMLVSQRVLYFSLGHLSTNPSLQATDAEYQQMLEGVSVLMADRKDPASLKAALASAGKFDIVFDNNVTSWWF